MADVANLVDLLVIPRGTRVKLVIFLSLFVLASSLIEDPKVVAPEKESMSRAALEDQEESHDMEADGKTQIHLPVSSGGSKQESLLHRAERAIKESMSWSKPEEEGVQSDGREIKSSADVSETTSDNDAKGNDASIKKDSSGATETKLADKSSSDESSSSEEKTTDDDWYNRQIKESLKETLQRATGAADHDQKALELAEEEIVKATSTLVDRIETVFSDMKLTIIEQLHHPQQEPEVVPEASSPGEADPNAIPFDSVPVAEENEEKSMFDNIKRKVRGLFSYKEEKDENSFLMPEDEVLSDFTQPEDRVAL